MANTIKFLKFIRKLFETAGIHPSQSKRNWLYNWRNSLILLFLLLEFIASAAFLLFVANSIEDYGGSFYITVLGFSLTFLWPGFIQNVGDLFNLMDHLDEFGQRSKSINIIVYS